MRPTTDIKRRVAPFEVHADFEPGGDQPAAIAELERRVRAGEQDVVLLGATGTGKTATIAWLAERLQRPMLVMQPNKTLAAQFATELRQFFPDNAVEYFVSYYDYYQPEAYVPQSDTYIEKDSSLNEEVERLRHSATNSLLTRRDVIVVATVSAIYGLGTPQEYVDRMLRLRVGEEHDMESLARSLVTNQYVRNDLAATRGTFRVALVAGGRPLAVLFATSRPVEIARAHVVSAFETDSPPMLLAGRPGAAQEDRGAIVCACYDVGVNTIVGAIARGEVTSVEAIGAALKAGSNCGSCRPELRSLLATHAPRLAAE